MNNLLLRLPVLLALAGGVYPVCAADVIVKWNEIAAQKMTGVNPLPHMREFSILHVAVYDAVISVTNEYEPYGFAVRAGRGASAVAAAITAAHEVLIVFHAGERSSLDAIYANDLGAIAEGWSKLEGVRVGREVAEAVLAARAQDGFSNPVPQIADGTSLYEWRRTPPNFAEPLLPQFAGVRPWVIQDAAQFLPVPPPGLRSFRYARDLNEVKSVGSSLSSSPQQKRDLALFHLESSPIFWNDATRQLLQENPGSLPRTARIFAAMNTAVMDSYIGAWHAKWNVYFNWRPVTAIRLADMDGNNRTTADVGWSAYGVTPPHPTYPSGHAVGAGSAAYVLAMFFGERGHSLTFTSPTAPGVTLQYSRLGDMVDDVHDARIYLGIHFRFDTEAGEKMGKQTARFVTRNAFRPRGRDRHDDDLCDWEP